MKITNKLKTILVKQYGNMVNDVSQGAVNYAIKKDMGQKAWKERKKINKIYNKFYEKTLKLYYYLKHDFKVDKYDNIDLDIEIETLKRHHKHVNSSNAMMKGYKRFNLSHIIMKWQSISIYLEEFPKLVEYMKDLAGEKYKGFDYAEETEFVSDSYYLYEDFSILAKINENEKK